MTHFPDLAISGTRRSSDAGCAMIGGGGHARVVAAVMARLGLTLAAVFEADPSRLGGGFAGIEILPEASLIDHPTLSTHIAIGSNAIRRRIASADPGRVWLTIVDPSALVMEDVEVGQGVFVNLGARLQTGVRLRDHVIVNTGAIIDHDCDIGAFSHIAPGATLCGGVEIGSDVLVGAGAVILPGVRVGQGAVVGAGAVVTSDVASGDTVTGSPARTSSSRRPRT